MDKTEEQKRREAAEKAQQQNNFMSYLGENEISRPEPVKSEPAKAEQEKQKPEAKPEPRPDKPDMYYIENDKGLREIALSAKAALAELKSAPEGTKIYEMHSTGEKNPVCEKRIEKGDRDPTHLLGERTKDYAFYDAKPEFLHDLKSEGHDEPINSHEVVQAIKEHRENKEWQAEQQKPEQEKQEVKPEPEQKKPESEAKWSEFENRKPTAQDYIDAINRMNKNAQVKPVEHSNTMQGFDPSAPVKAIEKEGEAGRFQKDAPVKDLDGNLPSKEQGREKEDEAARNLLLQKQRDEHGV